MGKIADLLYPKGLTCNVCGRELNDGEREYSVCADCAKSFLPSEGTPAFYGAVKVYACFEYEKAARKYVLEYKDSDKPFLCEYIAKYMYELYRERRLQADAVCYVPSSRAAFLRRGYDGMRYVAEEFSRLSGVPADHSLFRREGDDQTRVAYDKRRENVQNKFLSRGGFSGDVILLDDVVTSGATIEECAGVILSHGARSVKALAFSAANGRVKA